MYATHHTVDPFSIAIVLLAGAVAFTWRVGARCGSTSGWYAV